MKQRVLAGYILATPVLQALSFFLLPTAIIIGLVVNTPIALALLLFTPFIPMGLTTATQLIGLHDFCRRYDKRASGWHYASLAFLAPLYQIVLCGAAAVAIYRYAIGDNTWYKTGRAGEHRGAPTPTPTPPIPTPPALPADIEAVEGVAA